THGHSDHWMGLARLQKHFPEARGMATPDVVERATFEATNPGLSAYWQNSFRGELPAKPILPEALSREEFELAPRRPRQPAHPLALGAHRNGKSELTQPRPWPMTAYLRR
ncbi:MAG TPA: MBL fold metallo-hydrolase, partial [Candidatus Dormibacteraeota bacterium]|nr:MBL fold metallo-hydrolase [Candidatus Dormibacteraeota bacterium]